MLTLRAKKDTSFWIRYEDITTDESGNASSVVLDVKINKLHSHDADRIAKPFRKRVRGANGVSEEIPLKSQEDYSKALLDHCAERLGGPDCPDHPHGLQALFSDHGRLAFAPHMAKYGIPVLSWEESEQAEADGALTGAPWPMDRKHKWAMAMTFPGLLGQIMEAARAEAPVVSEWKEEEGN